MHSFVKKIVGIVLSFLLISCGDDQNSDGLPTTFDQHFQLTCNQFFKDIEQLPKQQKDFFFEKNSRNNVCNCAREKMINDSNYRWEGQTRDDNGLYKALKKYKWDELDPTYQKGYEMYTSANTSAIRSCVKE